MRKCIIVHYGEIGLKGKNRDFFERKLVTNIRRITGLKAKRKFGRLEVEYANGAEEKLRRIPGIRYFGVGFKTELDVESIKEAALRALPPSFKTFKVSASRSNKNFPLNSMELNREIGGLIVERTGKRVNLSNPDVTLWIEVCEKDAYVYSERVEGVGGLPVGTAGKVVSLVSGGIDSPVASFMVMKRGCEIVMAHFFNRTLHSPQVRKKIHELAEVLSGYQGEMRLYMVPFEEIQREIIRTVPARLRMLVYRRSMMRMANRIAERENARAIVTGDNLSQVASQTLENLNVIFSVSKLAVLSPLIGFDKEEIVSLAKRIGTYEVSILPYEDCCSLLVARHPETKAKVEDVEGVEKTVTLGASLAELEGSAVEGAEIIELG
jgi:thiamine biosynthesis protein ThiI